MRSWRAELRPSFCVIGRHGVQALCLQNPNRGPRFAGAAAATRRPGLGSFLSSTVQTRIDSGISSMLNHDLRCHRPPRRAGAMLRIVGRASPGQRRQHGARGSARFSRAQSRLGSIVGLAACLIMISARLGLSRPWPLDSGRLIQPPPATPRPAPAGEEASRPGWAAPGRTGAGQPATGRCRRRKQCRGTAVLP